MPATGNHSCCWQYQPPYENGTDGGTRTHTPYWATDFKSVVSAISPHQHVKMVRPAGLAPAT